MFRNDPRDLAATLSEMEYRARQLSNFNQVEAKQKMQEWVANDGDSMTTILSASPNGFNSVKITARCLNSMIRNC